MSQFGTGSISSPFNWGTMHSFCLRAQGEIHWVRNNGLEKSLGLCTELRAPNWSFILELKNSIKAIFMAKTIELKMH